MGFAIKALKNEALLDRFLAYKPAEEEHAAFVFVAKMPTEDTADLDSFLPVSVRESAKYYNVFAAYVRETVDIGRLVAKLRRAPAAETMNNLQKEARAIVMCLRTGFEDEPERVEEPRTPLDPRARFMQYTARYGVPSALAASYADAFAGASERLLDTIVLWKSDKGTAFVLLSGFPTDEISMVEAILSRINELILRLPAALMAATRMAVFHTPTVDIDALAARLRGVDPWSTMSFVEVTPGYTGKGGNSLCTFGEHVPLQLTADAPASRACAACGRTEPPDATEESKLHACGNCRVTLYCNKDCQKSHWKLHKKNCRRKNAGASS